jgi:hypothetical protein
LFRAADSATLEAMAQPQAPMTPQSLYRACMKEAAAQGRRVMQRIVARALIEMPQHAQRSPDVVERSLVGEAAKWLMKHEQQLCEAYPQALLAEFAQAIAGDARKSTGFSLDGLELMGEDQVQENVEVVRTQQSVQAAVEAELTELNALVCAVQGLKTVIPDRNPLRPEVYVRSLRSVIQQSPVPPAVRRRWLMHLGKAMGPELAVNYRELSALLRSHGVSEAGFAVSAVTSAPPPAPAPGADAAAAQQQRSTLLTVRELRRLLAGEFGGETAAPAPRAEEAQADFSVTVPAAFETLQEMRQVEEVMQRLRRRGDAGEGAADGHAMREAVRREARSPGQKLGLEVVQLMVEKIASDARLLPAVQQAVRELEPALLRLALSDPRFFSDRQHPARQLLDEMTQRSLAWTSEDSPGFAAFMQPLREAVEALLETSAPGADPFDFALHSLQDAWGDAQQRDRRVREKAVRALLQAEQRNLLAERIAREIRGRADMIGAPREVAQFLTGPWAQVMAQARLADAEGAADPEGYGAVVPDLLWSAQPPLASQQPARLVRLVPYLVDRIKRGLAQIDYPPEQVDRFLGQLAELHQKGLKPAPAEPERPAPVATRLTREELEAQFAEDDESWLAPVEARDSGFVETHQTAAPQPLFQPTQPAAFGDTRPQPEITPTLPALGLEPGAWVEMFDGQWVRWQLTWASPHGTLYLFTHPSGKTQSMTRRLMEKMLAGGTLRTVAAQTVVDGALDAVAQTAFRNSI